MLLTCASSSEKDAALLHLGIRFASMGYGFYEVMPGYAFIWRRLPWACYATLCTFVTGGSPFQKGVYADD